MKQILMFSSCIFGYIFTFGYVIVKEFEMTRYRKSPRDRTLWACGSFRARLCHTEGFVIISCYLAVTNLFMLQLRSKYLLIAYHHPSKYNCTMGIGLWSMLH